MTKNTKYAIGWYVYLIPALVLYVVFMAFPLVDSIRISFFTFDSETHKNIFIGFKNYIDLFTNSEYSLRFWGAFKNTWYFFFNPHDCTKLFSNYFCTAADVKRF